MRLAIVIVLIFALTSCMRVNSMNEEYDIRIIDSCEYLVFKSYSKEITHKGDCKNPIHDTRRN